MTGLKLLSLLICLIFLNCNLTGQCPVITETRTTPSCLPSCEMCEGGRITINLRGGDLPHNGRIEYFADPNAGFNPYSGQGTKIGEAMISTPSVPCRICPQMLGFMIDACGTEPLNEFVILWTGSGFNTSNLNFDFDAANNFGSNNNDIGSGGCGLAAGNAGLISGCAATSVGPGYNLPPNAILILFTSTGATTHYDFSAVCGLGLKVFVISNACQRTAGAFSNHTSTGTRTQTFSVSGCPCSTSVTYDTDDPALSGDGDNWAGGLGNNGCAAPDVNVPNYVPAPSTISSFSYVIPAHWCDKTYEIVGIVNPRPDPMCCSDVFTERIEVTVKCPKAKAVTMETCEISNGLGSFDLDDIADEILDGGSGIVEFYRDAAGAIKINSPLISSTAAVYARVVDGPCKSPIVAVQLKVNPLPLARKAADEKCDEGGGVATFDLTNLVQTISLNNRNVTVQFYRDPSGVDPILPPYISKTTTIFATTFDGKCESKPVEIKLTVLDPPKARSTAATACDEGDGRGIFILDLLKFIIQNDTSSAKTVKFFKEASLVTEVQSPYRSAKDTLYAVVYDSNCGSLPVPVYLELGKLPAPAQISDSQCIDSLGKTSFDLSKYFKMIREQDSSIVIKWYADTSLADTVSSPFIIHESDTIYAQLSKGTCKSALTPVVLNVIPAPKAFPTVSRLCADSSGTAEFYLPLLADSISGFTRLNVEFSQDSLFSTLIGPFFKTKGETIFARINSGNCISQAVKVNLIVDLGPDIFPINDTIVCDYFVLPAVAGMRLSPSAGYYDAPMGQGNAYRAGDTIFDSRKIFLYDNVGNCSDAHEFDIQLSNAPYAGEDHQAMICDGTQLDLTQLLKNADPGGIFTEPVITGRLSGSVLNSTGQADKIFTIYYIVPGHAPCAPDTSVLTIKVERTVNAPEKINISLCEGQEVDIFPFLTGATPGGIFTEAIPTGALSNGRWDSKISGTGNFTVRYEVGDDATCPKKTSTIEISVKPQIDIQMPSRLLLCDTFRLPAINGKNLGNHTAYYSLPFGSGMRYNESDFIAGSGSVKLYIYGDSPDYCLDHDTIEFILGQTLNTQYAKNNLCANAQEIIGNQIFDRNRPSGSVRISRGALLCDSIVQISLGFLPEIRTHLKNELCENDELIINNTIYDIRRPKGTEIFTAAAANGCDSIVDIDLTFKQLPKSLYTDSLCFGQFAVIEGQRFDRSNPNGTIIFPASQAGACDSLLVVDLQFYPEASTVLSPVLCDNGEITINGKLYNRNNLTGTDTLKNAAAKGCDSIIRVQVSILNSVITHLKDTICADAFVQVGKKIADINHPNVMDTLVNGASNGCDSIVNMQLYFYPENIYRYSAAICDEDSVIINGTVYNKTRNVGTERMPGAGRNNCDSIIHVQLSIHPKSSSEYNPSLCENGHLQINGNRYDKDNPQGTEIFTSSATGCDSIVYIALQFLKNVTFRYQAEICENDNITINNKVYNKGRLQGIDTLKGRASGGCDSIVLISLTTKANAEYTLIDTLCSGEFRIINGKRYDINNKSGYEILDRRATNGCDSIVRISFTFEELDIIAKREYTIGPGQSIQLSLLPNFPPREIEWTPSHGLSCTGCLDPIASPTSNTNYQVRMLSENGCEIIINVVVKISENDNVDLPNSFSPNGDNVNDVFRIISANANIAIKQFMVFDRWGEVLYSESDIPYAEHKGWNGRYRGRAMSPGVYIYYLSYSIPGSGETRLRKGDITLVY